MIDKTTVNTCTDITPYEAWKVLMSMGYTCSNPSSRMIELLRNGTDDPPSSFSTVGSIDGSLTSVSYSYVKKELHIRIYANTSKKSLI
jgi:hypothetical protein